VSYLNDQLVSLKQ